MSVLSMLAHSLKIRFGLAPNEPTDAQLQQIISAIQGVQLSRGYVTDEDWRYVVFKYCPTVETWKYAGLDNSDLNTLLTLALQATPKK